MSGSDREIEVKLPYASPDEAREALARLGARVTVERLFEDNALWDREHDPLKAGRRALRLRRVGDRSVLTYKAPVPGEHRHKVRIEHESEVDDPDAVERILDGLGFRTGWRYQKYRTEYALGGLSICLDETPLGCFVELEGEADEIDRTAAKMGFTPDRYERDDYRTLCEKAATREGKPPGDIVFTETP